MLRFFIHCCCYFFWVFPNHQIVQAQSTIKAFFKVPYEQAMLPVFVRGNIASKKLVLYVQGGYGETAIDFARADYPKWKHGLEQEVAIAYYDLRGLNQAVGKINRQQISYDQFGRDLIAISQFLHQCYDVELYWMGHSSGGTLIYHALATQMIPDSLLSGAIILNTPLTSDSDPKRYQHFRPLYLKNIAQEYLAQGKDSSLWQEAYNWMLATDSIHSPESSKQWNHYVDLAFEPSKRKKTLGMYFKVLFGRPYHPIAYLYRKDNELVADLMWEKSITFQLEPLLPAIRHPMLLITGRYDAIAGPEELAAAQALLPNASSVVLPEAGHESFLDQPELFMQAILDFLKNINK